MAFQRSTTLRGLLCLALAGMALAGRGPACGFAAEKSESGTNAVQAHLLNQLSAELPVLGHRNWIVVADSAYPAQSRAGIRTVHIGGDQAQAVAQVLKIVDQAKHVRSVVFLDEELQSVSEQDASGVEPYRHRLKELLGDRPVHTELHKSIIEKLDEAAETFRVVILKTDCTIPYTSVFIQLDCGYWSAEKEQRLRQTLSDKASP